MNVGASTLHDALSASLERDPPPVVTVFVSGGRELTGRLRAVTDEFIVLGSAASSYRVALAHIVWLQEH